MTCVAGCVDTDGTVVVGADSCASGDGLQGERTDKKILRMGPLVIAFAGCYRQGQVLQYQLDLRPSSYPKKSADLHGWMVNVFVEKFRVAREAAGVPPSDEFEALVAVRGRLFTMHSDLHIGEDACGFSAAGSGEAVALGALAVTGGRAESRVRRALTASSQFCTGVLPPFHLLRTET